MPFNSQVVELSSTELDNLFDASPDDNASEGGGAAASSDDSESTKVVSVKQPESTGFGSIPVLGDDEFAPEEGVEDAPKDKKVKDTTQAAEGEGEEGKNPIEGEGEDNEGEEGGDGSEAPVGQINEVLTNTVDFLIKSGKWVDFEGREGLEITQDIYADLASKQDEYRLSKMFSEMVDSTGDYGKAIITHIKQGGNPDEIIDLFKEQKQLDTINTDSEVGKQAVIEKYYKDILGWKPEKVERTIKRLIVDNEVETEFSDVKDLYDEHYKKELAAIQENAKVKEESAKQDQLAFANSIKTVLETDATLSVPEKNLVQSSIFNLRNTLPNGQKVNDFYLKFNQMKSDPKEYIDFVRFVMNKEEYKNSLRRTEKTNANAAAFNFIKGGAAITKAAPASIEINKNPAKAKKGTDFSFALK